MRATLLIVLLAACGGRGSDPAWPKQTVAEDDGGESLAPRTAAAVVATTDDDEADVTPAVETAIPVATPAVPAADKPATPTVTAPEQVIQIDDIVIEIED